MTATTDLDHASPMFDDAVRLLKILQVIPQHRWIDTKEIDERLRDEGIIIAQRTLQRCLKTLREAAGDFGIECDMKARPLRYRWRPGAKGIVLPRLTPAEAVLLRMVEEALRQRLPTGPLQGLRPLLRAARRNLDASTSSDSESSWLRKIIVTHAALPVTIPAIRQSVFAEVVAALLDEKVLHAKFRRDTGRYAEIDLHPLGLIQHRARTFLVGYEEHRGIRGSIERIQRRRTGDPNPSRASEIGLYALHRMDAARSTLLDAIIPEDFHLEDFARRINFEGKRGRTIRLTIVTDSADLVREVLESPLCATQEASVDPEATPEMPLWRLEAVLEDSALLDAWLAERAEWIVRSTKAQLREPAPFLTESAGRE